MFKIEESTSPDGECRGVIFMRPDGSFEGRIYRRGVFAVTHAHQSKEDEQFQVCALTETLTRARTIVYEELGL
jgi:hypothetical protein